MGLISDGGEDEDHDAYEDSEHKLYRTLKNDTNAMSVQQINIILKPDSSMNDVYVPIKATANEIFDL